MYILFALVAAAGFALSTVLKHRSATDYAHPRDAPSGAFRLMRLVAFSVRHPLWLTSIAIDAGALACQIVALHLGPIAVVQPLLVTSLVLAFLISRGCRLQLRELRWPLTIVGLLGLVSYVAAASGASETADLLPTAVGIGMTLAVIAVGLRLVIRPSRRLRNALVLGAGVGVIYATTAALLKTLSDHATTGGVVDLLSSWQLYAVLLVGAAGLVLNQAAFNAGPMHESLPAISAVDPVVSVGIGVVIYDERLRDGTLGLMTVAFAVILLAVAIVRLGELERPKPPRPTLAAG